LHAASTSPRTGLLLTWAAETRAQAENQITLKSSPCANSKFRYSYMHKFYSSKSTRYLFLIELSTSTQPGLNHI
jgi:predicted metalloprotease with PDZ domain